MPRKDDRRVLRTRKLLRDSLIALILERGYDEVNIQDITDHANLGRATFYLHYHEKDELLADVLRQFSEEYLSSGPQVTLTHGHLTNPKSVQHLFEFAENHYDFYRIMMIGRGSVTATRQLLEILRESFTRALLSYQKEDGESLKAPVDFLANYMAGSLLSLVYWWMDNEMPYSAAQMSAMVQQFSLINHPELLVAGGQALNEAKGDGHKTVPAAPPPPAKTSAKPPKDAQHGLPPSAEEAQLNP